MVEETKSWIKENSTLIYFLVAQMIAVGAAGASLLAYMVKLETRVSIMETRGAEFTVGRIGKLEERISNAEHGLEKDQAAVDSIHPLRDRVTILEQNIKRNETSIERLVQQYLKDRNRDNRP